jgi:hypothetical protein
MTPLPRDGQIRGACPLDCPDACSWIVTIKNGASTKGRWPCNSKHGTTINITVDERDSDMGGGAVYHGNRVRVDKEVSPDARAGDEPIPGACPPLS